MQAISASAIAILITGMLYFGDVAQAHASCMAMERNLSRGSKGQDVRALQAFLVSQNYPGSGSWMITGTFGRATEVAVQNFQVTQHIPVTGIVDSQTRIAFDRMTCGGGSYYSPAPTINPFSTPSPLFPQPIPQPYAAPIFYGANPAQTIAPAYVPNPYGCPTVNLFSAPQNCVEQVHMISLFPNSGAVGSQVTIYGSGFSKSGNTVKFGTGVITNLISVDGKAVSFTVPAQLIGFGNIPMTIGSYPVSVANSFGQTSEVQQFYVSDLSPTSVSRLSNVTGPSTIGQYVSGQYSVTVTNSVLSNATININYGDGSTDAATQYVSGGSKVFNFSHAYSTAGTFNVTFTVTGGPQTSGLAAGIATLTVTVTPNSAQSSGSLTVTSVNPQNASVGSQVTITGSGFNSDNAVHFGSGGTLHLPSSNGTTILYTIPYSTSPCDLIGSGCASPSALVVRGSYPIYITNSQGTSNTQFVSVQ